LTVLHGLEVPDSTLDLVTGTRMCVLFTRQYFKRAVILIVSVLVLRSTVCLPQLRDAHGNRCKTALICCSRGMVMTWSIGTKLC